MKKHLVLMGLAIFSLGLGACSNNEDTGGKAETGSNEAPAEQTSTKLSNEEVLQKISEASDKLSSAEVTTKIDSNTTMNDQTTTVKATSKIQYTLDPFVMKTETEDSASGQKMVMYMNDKSMYMQIPGSDQWQTVDLNSMGIDVADQMNKANSTDILNELKNFMGDMSVEEKDGTYILSYEGSGDDLKDIVTKAASSSESNTDLEAAAEGVTVDEFDYSMVVDAKTFYPISYELDMNYQLSSEAMELQMDQHQEASFDKINEIKEIELPVTE
jgi:hypothetical protein